MSLRDQVRPVTRAAKESRAWLYGAVAALDRVRAAGVAGGAVAGRVAPDRVVVIAAIERVAGVGDGDALFHAAEVAKDRVLVPLAEDGVVAILP